MRRALALALGAACALCACSEAERDPGAPPAYELRAVGRAALAALPAPPPTPAPDAALVARLREQIVGRASLQGKMRALVLDEVAGQADAAVAAARAVLDDPQAGDEASLSALEVLGAVATPAALETLAGLVDIQRCHEPWKRARAAYEASRIDADVAVPALCAQLKYETDGETVVWIATYLARQRVYAGLDGLRFLAGGRAEPDVRELAAATLAEIAREAGFDDPDALHAAWNGADPERRVPRKEPSDALRAAIWRRVADLGVFDLKQVDDARFVLSRSPWWVTDVLVQALHEEEEHLRACVAQSLERMGPRAAAACAALVEALAEPRTAPAMAKALAAIGCADAVEPLVRCTEPGAGADLRHAAARALAALGGQRATDALVALLAQADAPDLRQTAAEGLVALGEGARGAALLQECLTRPGADHHAAETALEAWLEREASAGGAPARDALAAWQALAGEPGRTASVAEAEARHRARAALLGERLPALLGGPR